MNCFEYYMLVHTGCSLFVALLSSFVLALMIVPVMRKIAWHFNILDIPDGSVKKHKQPTPYLGGVAVYLVCLIPLVYASFYYSQAIYLLGGCTILVLVGLIDDLLILSPSQKFLGGVNTASPLFAHPIMPAGKRSYDPAPGYVLPTNPSRSSRLQW